MLLVIDAGNSNIVFALMRNDKVLLTWRHPTGTPLSARDLAAALKKAGAKPEALEGGILGSVVPKATPAIQKAFKGLITKDLVVLESNNPNIGISLGVDEPDKIGVDRVANAVAGAHFYGGPLIIIDFGTATTFTVVSKDLVILGGAIAAGIETSLKSLHVGTANLPAMAFGYAGPVIGKNTQDAMGSGAFFGALSMIEGMIARFTRELRQTPTVLATGGLAIQFSGKTKAIDHYRPNLTLHGLRLAYERMTQS